MISKVLIYNTQHEAADALKKLESNGFTSDRLRVLVSNVENSKLLNAETAIHIDLLSEIARANRSNSGEGDNIFITPFFTPQSSVQLPMSAMPGMIAGGWDEEHAMGALRSYGFLDENASICMHALREGKCIVCILDEHMESSLFDSLYMGMSDEDYWIPETGAATILKNQ